MPTCLFFQSEDTVTTISSFALQLLGMYPDIQNRVIEEIVTVVGERDIEESDLGKLIYLDMVIKDVLRLFPIAPFIAREASQDFQLGEADTFSYFRRNLTQLNLPEWEYKSSNLLYLI